MGVNKTVKLSVNDLVDQAPSFGQRGVIIAAYYRDSVILRRLVAGDSIVVGRAQERCAMTLDAPDLSLRHAEVRNVDGSVLLEDLGSSNGTWVHGKRIEGSKELFLGDEARLGSVLVVVQGTAKERSARHPLSYERFRCSVEDEIARAKLYEKTFSLATIRGAPKRGAGSPHVSQFIDRVLDAARDIDRLTLYGPDTVMMLLPELARHEAEEALSTLISGEPQLGVTIASYPESGTEADVLLGRLYEERLALAAPHREPAQRGRTIVTPISSNAFVKHAFDKADKVADSDLPVLISGETGVGKEVLAKRIHERAEDVELSLRINCAAIPDTLVEGTLFGHKRGAFTDAKESATGLFIAARKGTLFLDEIGRVAQSSSSDAPPRARNKKGEADR